MSTGGAMAFVSCESGCETGSVIVAGAGAGSGLPAFAAVLKRGTVTGCEAWVRSTMLDDCDEAEFETCCEPICASAADAWSRLAER